MNSKTIRFLLWLCLGSAGYVFTYGLLAKRKRREKEKEEEISTLLGTVFPSSRSSSTRLEDL